MNKIVTIIFLVFVFCTSTAFAEKYSVDPEHTTIGFSIKHMTIANVKGWYEGFNGVFEVTDGSKLNAFRVEIAATSVNTKIKKRDDHLRSSDFFNVEKFPYIRFQLLSVEGRGDNLKTITGELTIRDITRKIELEGSLTASIKDPWGNIRRALRLQGKINRKDFGLTYNKILESGGILIGNEVDIYIEGEGILVQ